MIIIWSNSKDGVTAEVVRWLEFLSSNEIIIRINTDIDKLNFIKFDNTNQEFILEKDKIFFNLYDCNSFWYRRGNTSNFISNIKEISNNYYEGLRKSIQNRIILEYDILNDFILTFLEENSKIKINSHINSAPNKLSVLRLAKEKGLSVPNSYIVTSKEELKIILKKENEIITKSMSDGIYYFDNNFSFYTYTELINRQLINIPHSFSPSFFQTNIEKKFEVRTFFLENDYYSMAIFSQKNKQTQVDFRKYDETLPNRCVPFDLPQHIIVKLQDLFRELKMNSGSVDFIVDKNDEFYFLEINPVGQFSMVSYPCNYYLEKKIAQYLLNHNGK
jgi:ATP-GRASP peptide maturase of grasp-with-spasm system